MEIQLPEEQRSVIENLVASGRFSTMQDAVVEGVRLLAASETLRSRIAEAQPQRQPRHRQRRNSSSAKALN